MSALRFLALLAMAATGTASVHAQAPPDLSGIWRLNPAESRMIGGGGPPSDEYQLTWLIDHREPEISVVVNVREAGGSQEFAFGCTTDGRGCVSELPSIQETRHMTAVWDGDTLIVTQRASSPRGDFYTRDRVFLAHGGERLIFERVVTNDRGDRHVRQVFRKLGPHPLQRVPPEPLPNIDLPAELDRVLRETHLRERADVNGRVDSDGQEVRAARAHPRGQAPMLCARTQGGREVRRMSASNCAAGSSGCTSRYRCLTTS